MNGESDRRTVPGPGEPPHGGPVHPPEDDLIGFALGEGGEAVGPHLRSCARCARFVGEMRQVRDAMVTLDTTDPPGDIRDLVMRTIKRQRQADTVENVLQSPLSRTFLLGLVLVFYVIFMYVITALLDMGV